MAAEPTSAPSPSTHRRGWAKALALRAARFVILGLLLAWGYAWAMPRFYPRQGLPGFAHGMLHGALMPMALPSLVVGKDVTIYAENNTGRSYKLGYTIGINICGFVVFGMMFWTPRRSGSSTARPKESP